MTFTAKELGEKLGIDDAAARGVIEFMIKKELVKYVGDRPMEAGKKGRGSKLFEEIPGAKDRLVEAFRGVFE